MPASLHILGIRHHGPGSARSVLQALDQLRPDVVLIEGPPDAQSVIELAAHEQMSPPVALLVYQADQPRTAVFYPFADFSPEWTAIRWALANKTTVRFIDLPLQHRFAASKDSGPGEPTEIDPSIAGTPVDPLEQLARIAGFEDSERWWDQLVESRPDAPIELFDEIRTAIAEVRDGQPTSADDALREAHMRQMIRDAAKQRHQTIAVVCGAYHAPLLGEPVLTANRSTDAAALNGLPKVKTIATWVPWTHERLTFASGYGAGVIAPGWYHHLWTHQRDHVEHWMTGVARLLRDKGLDCSSASVIEAVRLSHALAGLRARPIPDLSDINDATRAVFCFDAELPMTWAHRDLTIGDRMGRVPDDTPMIPLHQDVLSQQRRLRLKPDALERDLDLDLRNETDLLRSQLLHRLRLLGIPWGEVRHSSGTKGTFREAWKLRWQVEFVVQIVERSALGNTVESATTSYIAERALVASNLSELVALVDDVMLAGLPDAVVSLMEAIANVAAVAADVAMLMDALPPLARVLRYGTVRKLDIDMIRRATDGLLPRITAGLGAACASLNDEAAAAMCARITSIDQALPLVDSQEHQADWSASLQRIATQDSIHGAVRGRAARCLFDSGSTSIEQIAVQLSLALSTGNDPKQGADWLEGFLHQSGLLLIHDARLLGVIDAWVSRISTETLDGLLPLLRRTFSSFEAAERRQIGQQLAKGRSPVADPPTDAPQVDPLRATRVLPYLKQLLGGPQ